MSAWRSGATAGCMMLLLPALVGGAGSRVSPELPFGPGEELAYRMRASPFGTIGRAVLRVGGPEVVRGVEVYTLHFDTNAKVGPLSASQHSRSWLDPERFAALRYVSREKQPLSLLYFVRTLPLTEVETTVVRPFDPKRNPIRVRVGPGQRRNPTHEMENSHA